MKNLFICFSLIVPSIGFCCPTLDGKWASSLQEFELFNKKWANVDANAWSFMMQTQGHEVIEFNDKNEMLITTPEIKFEMGTKKMTLPAKKELITFDIIGCTENSIALKYERYGKAHITQMHFEKEHTFWQYMGSTGSDGNSHIREFYVKAK